MPGSEFPEFLPTPGVTQPGSSSTRSIGSQDGRRNSISNPPQSPRHDSENRGVEEFPADISLVPDDLVADKGDKARQWEILREIHQLDFRNEKGDRFEKLDPRPISLSRLRSLYKRKNEKKALDLLCERHTVEVDDDLRLLMGTGQVSVNTEESTIDFQMTVANCVGLSPLLPKMQSAHRFGFDLELKKEYREFNGKCGMLGFDPAGCMLFIGRLNHEDVFLAMAPDEFLKGRAWEHPHTGAAGRGRRSASGSSCMSTRHYRQVVIMLCHFLVKMRLLPYIRLQDLYQQKLDSHQAEFDRFTDVTLQNNIRLNFEHIKDLDTLLVDGLHEFVNDAPDDWTEDGFLLERSPIVVTTRFGQNAHVCVEGNELEEAHDWHTERDYSKIAFLTVAIATSIDCMQIREWDAIDNEKIKRENEGQLFDGTDPDYRRQVDLDTYELLDERGLERKIYDVKGKWVPRRDPIIYRGDPSCGVLINLTDVEALFNTDKLFDPARSEEEEEEEEEDDDVDAHVVKVDVYPLGFLRTAGNVQANGVPRCFYPVLKEVNESVRRSHPNNAASSRRGRGRGRGRPPYDSSDSEPNESSDNGDGDGDWDRGSSEEDAMEDDTTPSIFQAIKPMSCQFYNYLAHRVAGRAGAHDAQQGTLTSAITGGFAQSTRDKKIALEKQRYCDIKMPHERFHTRISSVENCPTSCRAELVYSVDVRALKNPSGSFIYTNVITPLVRSWRRKDIRDVVNDYLIVLKPEAFPALYDWVSYPVTRLMELLYESEMEAIRQDEQPCPYRLELLASLERTLCFCHTGSAKSLATSLMRPLGLSKGLIVDGFPVLLQTFREKTLVGARDSGFEVDRRRWPTKDGHPAVASKRSQEVTYSESYFLGYQASFRINHALSVSYKNVYDMSYTLEQNKAMVVLVIALNSFIDDTKKLVKEGVKKDVASRKAEATTQEERKVAFARGSSRLSYLKSWLKSSHPLSYVDDDEEDLDPYKLLLQAVMSDKSQVGFGFPNWNRNAKSPFDLSRLLLDMSAPVDPIAPMAPVLRAGSFLPVLKVAHKAILSMTRNLSRKDQLIFLTSIFKDALAHMKIRFFPASKHTPEGHVGPRFTVPVFDCWGHMGLPDQSGPFHIREPRPAPPRAIQNPATVALNNAVATDCNAPWTAAPITLKKLHLYLNKKSLPSDFCRPFPSSHAYVNETHEWVRKNYNAANPVHHLSLLIGIIVASSILPYVFTDTTVGHLFQKNFSKQRIRTIYNGLEWKTKNKGGLKDKAIFVSMVTTFIIALYEPESPLRKYMKEGKKGGRKEKDGTGRTGLGTPWTDKYTPKGLSYTTLIRLGVLWGTGTGAFRYGTFEKNWGCHSFKEMIAFHKTLCDCLKKDDDNFGPFDALAHLIGRKNAHFFGSTRINIRCRDSSGPSPSQKSASELGSSDDDMVIDT